MLYLNRTLPLILVCLLGAPQVLAFSWNLSLPDFLNSEPPPGDAPASKPAPATSNGQRTVSGAASKGPIAGATISVSKVDAAGNPVEEVASTTTDSNGRFTVSLPPVDSRDQGQIFGTFGLLPLETDTWSQSITAGASGPLTRIEMQFENLPTASAGITLSIFSGGNPTAGSPLHTESLTITAADLESPNIFSWNLDTAGLSFVAGDVFTLELTADNPGFSVAGNDSPGYDGGNLFRNGTLFGDGSEPSPRDIAFITFVESSDGGLFLVQTSGGSFIDESDQRPLDQRRRITLGPGEGFTSVIMPGQSEVAITPYTDAMVTRARIGSAVATSDTEEGTFEDIMNELIAASSEGFGFSIFSTIPVDPVAPPADATEAQLQYALLLGTVANWANAAAVQMGLPAPTYNVIRDVIWDMSDGSTDGFQDDERIQNFDTGQFLPVIDFDQQLVRFRNNNYRHYVDVPLPEWNNADEVLGLGFPQAMFIRDDIDVGKLFGLDAIEFVGKLELSSDGTARLTNNLGSGDTPSAGFGNASWDSFNTRLRVDFGSEGWLETEQIDGDLRTYDIWDRLEFNRTSAPGVHPIQAEVRSVGREEQENLVTGEITVLQEFDETDPITLFDVSETVLDEPPEFDFMPAFPAVIDNDDNSILGAELMIFSEDGTGVTGYRDLPFNWALAPNGSLRLDFANGEYANYYVLTLDEDGDGGIEDYVAADYFDGEKMISIGGIVYSKDLDLTWDPLTVPGVYATDLSDSNLLDTAYHLYPDGTGVFTFTQPDANSGLPLIGVSQLRICWYLDDDGYLVRERFTLTGADLVRGDFPTPGQCAALTENNTTWRRQHDLFDTAENNGLRTVFRFFQNPCGTGGTFPEECQPLELENSRPALYTFTALTAIPPIPSPDFTSTQFDTPVSINVTANDIPGDLSIDPGSLVVVSDPFEVTGGFRPVAVDGTLEVTADNQLLYTPDASNPDPRSVRFHYQVSDTSGNQSIPGRVFVEIESAAPPPPPTPDPVVVLVTPSSLNDSHTVGISPCPDPVGSIEVSLESGSNFTIDGVSVTGTIDGFIEAFESSPGTVSSLQFVDVQFNCASAAGLVRSGSIVIDVTDTDSGEPGVATVAVTHEVIP